MCLEGHSQFTPTGNNSIQPRRGNIDCIVVFNLFGCTVTFYRKLFQFLCTFNVQKIIVIFILG